MALLNRGATALDPVAYDDQIFSTGAAARSRRVGRNSEYISIESGAYQTPYQEPEVKLRNPKSRNLKSVDAPSPLRSRENSVCNVVQPHRIQDYPTCNALRSSSRPLKWETPTNNDAAKPLRSKENTFQRVHTVPRNLEIKYSGRSSNDGRRSSPPLPARDGITNHACWRRFMEKQQQGEYVTIEFHKSDLQAGKRLHFAQIKGSIWICSWESSGGIALEQQLHPGDELIKVNDIVVKGQDVNFVHTVISSIDTEVRLTLRRAPHAMALIVNRTFPEQDLGIKVENNIIKSISASGAFGSSTNLKLKTTGVITAGTLVDWAITEINWQPVNFYANTKEVETLLHRGKKDVALVVQPSDLVVAMKEESNLCSKCGVTPSPPSSPRCSNCNLSLKSNS
ncbi:uncharacterized protein [Amphiura filiformis]|uniref:uncharacterized protein n=1 Tax=Amphiura filiformis TaxID=82378 RepID=UPI003B20F5DC